MKKNIRLLSVLVPLLTVYGCGGDMNKETIKTHSVYTTVPCSNSAVTTHNYTSTVEEGRSVNTGFKTGGQIARLTVNEGDRVTKGQVIGFLDDADYQLSVKQLEAQYSQMTSEMKRLDEMFRRNNIAPNDYEKARAGFVQLETQLDMTRNKLAYTRLEAPTSGYVVERYMEEGEMVGAGTPIYRIIDTSGLETSVALPSSIYSRRDKIVRCTGTSPQLGDTAIPLETICFVPDADNNSLFRLRLKIPETMRDRLLPGMSLSVALQLDNSGATDTYTVPSRSIYERNGREYVWVVNLSDSTLVAKEVGVTGSHEGDVATVVGLEGNEIIVAAGVHHLTAGEKVRVMGEIKRLFNKAC